MYVYTLQAVTKQREGKLSKKAVTVAVHICVLLGLYKYTYTLCIHVYIHTVDMNPST